MSELKETAINTIRLLPDDVDWRGIIEELAFRMRVDEGLLEADAGATLDWEDVKAELGLL